MKHLNFRLHRLISFAAIPAILFSCVSIEPNPEIVQMEQRFVRVSTLPGVRAESASRLETARAAIDRSEIAHNESESELVNHELIVAGKTLDIVEKRAALRITEQEVDNASDRRQALLLQARERDAAMAQRQAQASAAALSATNAVLEARNRELTAAERQAQQTAAALDQRNQQLTAAERRAQDAAARLDNTSRTLEQRNRQLAETAEQLAARELQLNSLLSQAQELASELDELRMETNERGMVLTLSDIIFDFDSANLKPGSERAISQIADFLKENDDRQLIIEGFTDAVGAADYNHDLSVRRARSVQAALADGGVDNARMSIAGFGEDFPVASNDSDPGRQANRRVEIIVGDKGGIGVAPR